MIYLRDLDDEFRKIACNYSISGIEYTSSLMAWTAEHHIDLDEPAQFMKAIVRDNCFSIMVQEEVSEEVLDSLIDELSIRWMVHDNMSAPESILNTIKKRLVYVFLKECARTIKDLEGNEMKEDEWAIRQIEKTDFC